MSVYKTERKALDHSHHLSELAVRRGVSPLKGLFKYAAKPGMLVLAGGMPHEDYFPFDSISAQTLVADSYSTSSATQSSSGSWFWKMLGFGSSKETRTQTLTIPRYPTEFGQINLATSLQYGSATGIVQLQKFLKEFSGNVFQPAYDDWTTMVHTGNTDAWTRCVLTVLNPGEGFLTEEWTYPSAIASAAPYQIKPISVPIDAFGMRIEALRQLLADWDESARGMKRPRVMYTVPVGQNPSGVNVPFSRKKEIYDICVEYDVIIIEDDPYYFQQFAAYDSDGASEATSSAPYSAKKYLASLVPSYLKIDYQGRVIRLDTFSKTIAPGSRLGWFTCAPLFAERLERQGETTTQAPCGFGQSLITQLLTNWQYEGYIRWLHGINAQYEMRRNRFIKSLTNAFEVTPAPRLATGMWSGCDVLVASEKIMPSSRTDEKRVFGRKQYFSFVPPAAGMFIWIKVHFAEHPAVLCGDEDESSLEMKLFLALAEAGVLIAPGWYFAADSTENHDEERGEGHYRIAFSHASPDEMKKACDVFAGVLHQFFSQ